MSIYVPHWLVLWVCCAVTVVVAFYATLIAFDLLSYVTTRISMVLGAHAEILWFIGHRQHVHAMWNKRKGPAHD